MSQFKTLATLSPKHCADFVRVALSRVRDALRMRFKYNYFVGKDDIAGSRQAGWAADGHELADYFNLVLRFDDRTPVAVDCAHNLLITGAVLALKPKNILELGVGSGFVTASIIHALRYNRCGTLTSVDNWVDTKGVEPGIATQLETAGVNLVRSGEEEFVRQAPTDMYDLLIADGDHFNSPRWFDQYLRIVRHNGLLFLHDTNQPEVFPELAQIVSRVQQLNLPHYHFKEDSRPDERCSRGLLLVINTKPL